MAEKNPYLEKMKAALDKAKATADKIDGAVDSLNDFAGKYARLVPGLGQISAVVVVVADGLRSAVDVLDAVVSQELARAEGLPDTQTGTGIVSSIP